MNHDRDAQIQRPTFKEWQPSLSILCVARSHSKESLPLWVWRYNLCWRGLAQVQKTSCSAKRRRSNAVSFRLVTGSGSLGITKENMCIEGDYNLRSIGSKGVVDKMKCKGSWSSGSHVVLAIALQQLRSIGCDTGNKDDTRLLTEVRRS